MLHRDLTWDKWVITGGSIDTAVASSRDRCVIIISNVCPATCVGPLTTHVSNISAKCAQLSFALKTLRSHGLAGTALWEVTRAHIINRLTYASSAWWGFCGTGEKEQLGAVVTRLVRMQFLPPDQPSLQDIIDAADMRFFRKILSNPCHVLASLIPPEKTHSYNLRTRRTNLQLPPPNSNSDKNSINRIIIGLNAP